MYDNLRYTMHGLKILASGGIDTLVIIEITNNSFSTLLTTTAIINDSIETEEINIITEYEKL